MMDNPERHWRHWLHKTQDKQNKNTEKKDTDRPKNWR